MVAGFRSVFQVAVDSKSSCNFLWYVYFAKAV